MPGMDPTLSLGKYDLGTQRSLSAYESFVGVSLSNQVIVGETNGCGDLEVLPADPMVAQRELAQTSPKESERSARWMDPQGMEKPPCAKNKLLERQGVGGFTDRCHFEGHTTLNDCEHLLVAGNCGALTYKHEACFLHDTYDGTDFATEPAANSIVVFKSCSDISEGSIDAQGGNFQTKGLFGTISFIMLLTPYLFFYASQPTTLRGHYLSTPQSPMYSFDNESFGC
jgi:hypothetical protein